MQNLYVREGFRGQRFGFRLVQAVVDEALRTQCAFVKIGLLKSNLLALDFYRNLGCVVLDHGDFWRCKLDRSALQKLAQPQPIEK